MLDHWRQSLAPMRAGLLLALPAVIVLVARAAYRRA